jgi:beta-glucosidase-like glycosyl hydrolase
VKLCAEDTPVENELFESDDLQTRPVADYVLARRNYLSKEQMERVTAIIQKIQPEIPVFVAVMQKSNVQPLGSLVSPTLAFYCKLLLLVYCE